MMRRSNAETGPGPLCLQPGVQPGAAFPGGACAHAQRLPARPGPHRAFLGLPAAGLQDPGRWEEHTSELQSPCNLVCRLLLEKKKNHHTANIDATSSAS